MVYIIQVKSLKFLWVQTRKKSAHKHKHSREKIEVQVRLTKERREEMRVYFRGRQINSDLLALWGNEQKVLAKRRIAQIS